MAVNDNIKSLHDYLVGKGAYEGDVESFKMDISTPENRKSLHEYMLNNGYYEGDLNSFEQSVGGIKKVYTAGGKQFDTKDEAQAYADEVNARRTSQQAKKNQMQKEEPMTAQDFADADVPASVVEGGETQQSDVDTNGVENGGAASTVGVVGAVAQVEENAASTGNGDKGVVVNMPWNNSSANNTNNEQSAKVSAPLKQETMNEQLDSMKFNAQKEIDKEKELEKSQIDNIKDPVAKSIAEEQIRRNDIYENAFNAIQKEYESVYAQMANEAKEKKTQLMIPGASQFAQDITRSKIQKEANDPSKMLDASKDAILNKPEVVNLIDMLVGDEVARYETNPSEEEVDVIRQQVINDKVMPMLEQDYMLKTAKKLMPKNTWEYLANSVSNSVTGMLTGLDKSKGLRQAELMAMELYNPSGWEEAAGMGVGILSDLPLMAIPGAVSARGVSAFANMASKGMAEKLIAQGVEKEAARAIAQRAAQSRMLSLGNRLATSSIAGGLNFAGWEGISSAVSQAYQKGEINPLQLGADVLRGAAAGAAMGVFGAALKGGANKVYDATVKTMTDGTTKKIAGAALDAAEYTTSLAGRTALLASSGFVGQWINAGINGEEFDASNFNWGKEFAHAALMNIGFDGIGLVRGAVEKGGIKKYIDAMHKEGFTLSEQQIRQLNKAGFEGKDFYEVMENIADRTSSVQTQEGKEVKRIVQSYGDVLGSIVSNPNIDTKTKVMMNYVFSGKLYNEGNLFTSVSPVERTEEGKYIVRTNDINGLTWETKEFKSKSDADKYYVNAIQNADANKARVIEGMSHIAFSNENFSNAIDEAIVTLFNGTESNVGELRGEFVNIYNKGKQEGLQKLDERERAIYYEVERRLQPEENEKRFNAAMSSINGSVAEEYGKDSKWLDNAIGKNPMKRTTDEQRAVAKYFKTMEDGLIGERNIEDAEYQEMQNRPLTEEERIVQERAMDDRRAEEIAREQELAEEKQAAEEAVVVAEEQVSEAEKALLSMEYGESLKMLADDVLNGGDDAALNEVLSNSTQEVRDIVGAYVSSKIAEKKAGEVSAEISAETKQMPVVRGGEGTEAEVTEAEGMEAEDAGAPAVEGEGGVVPMPMDEKGKPAYAEAGTERSAEYIYNESGLEEEDADGLVDNKIDKTKKELAKVSNEKPKSMDIDEIKAERADINARKAAVEQELALWEGIKEARKAQIEAENAAKSNAEKDAMEAAERKSMVDDAKSHEDKINAAKAAYNDESGLLDDLTPQNAFEYVADNLPKHGISWEGYDVDGHHVRGLQEELGSNFKRGGKNADTYPFRMYIAKGDKGIGVEEMVHQLWENAPTDANGEKLYNTEELRNALIEIMRGAEKHEDIRDYVLNNRVKMLDEMAKAEERLIEEAKRAEDVKEDLKQAEKDSMLTEDTPDDVYAKMNDELNGKNNPKTDTTEQNNNQTNIQDGKDNSGKESGNQPQSGGENGLLESASAAIRGDLEASGRKLTDRAGRRPQEETDAITQSAEVSAETEQMENDGENVQNNSDKPYKKYENVVGTYVTNQLDIKFDESLTEDEKNNKIKNLAESFVNTMKDYLLGLTPQEGCIECVNMMRGAFGHGDDVMGIITKNVIKPYINNVTKSLSSDEVNNIAYNIHKLVKDGSISFVDGSNIRDYLFEIGRKKQTKTAATVEEIVLGENGKGKKENTVEAKIDDFYKRLEKVKEDEVEYDKVSREFQEYISKLSDEDIEKAYDLYKSDKYDSDVLLSILNEYSKNERTDRRLNKRMEDNKRKVDNALKKENKNADKINLYDFAEKDKIRHALTGIYHDRGYEISTDGKCMIIVKKKYDKKLEGNITAKDGSIIEQRYPRWLSVLPNIESKDAITVSFDDIKSSLEILKAKIKEEGLKKKDYNYLKVNVGSVDAPILISYELMEKFSKNLSKLGTDVNAYLVPSDKLNILVFETDGVLGFVMPIRFSGSEWELIANKDGIISGDEYVEYLRDNNIRLKKDVEGDKTLVGVHNLTEDNLEHALFKNDGNENNVSALNAEGVMKLADEMKERYNVEVTEVFKGNDTRDELLEKGYNNLEILTILHANFQNSKSDGERIYGFYSPYSGKVCIFAGAISDASSEEVSIFHENIHQLVNSEEAKAVENEFFNSGANEYFARSYESSKAYNKGQQAEEFFVDALATAMTDGDVDVFKSYLEEEGNKLVDNILKSLRYDNEREMSARKGSAIETRYESLRGSRTVGRTEERTRRTLSWLGENNVRTGERAEGDGNILEVSSSELNGLGEGGDGGISGEGLVKFKKVTDKKLLDELESGNKVKAYRAMQLIDGKLYPPMAAKQEDKLVNPIELGVWEQSEEHPELAVEKNGNWYFGLDKANGSKPIPARYNPYIHTSMQMLNDQFTSAWSRPNMVVTEVEVPESELTSGYKADKAKDAVGKVDWKSGSVSGKLAKQGKPRQVILTRYDKPVRVVPTEEVAKSISYQLEGTDIEIPFNTVNPELRDALVNEGVKIGEPEKGNAGAASREAYEEWKSGKNTFVFNRKANELKNIFATFTPEEIGREVEEYIGRKIDAEIGEGFDVDRDYDLINSFDEETYNSLTRPLTNNDYYKAPSYDRFHKQSKEDLYDNGDLEEIKSLIRMNLTEQHLSDTDWIKKNLKELVNAVRFKDEGRTSKDIKDNLGLGEDVGVVGGNVYFDEKSIELLNKKDKIYRGINEFEDGQVLKVKEDEWGGEYSVEGLGGVYGSRERVLNEFRNKYPEYISILNDDGNIVVLRWIPNSEPNERDIKHSQREFERMKKYIEDTKNLLGLNVDVIENKDGLKGKEAKAKGWYNTETKTLTIVLPNHRNVSDVQRTMMHEAVAHHGLRELFGEDFDIFLDNVFANLPNRLKDKAVVTAITKYNGNKRTATEEILADIAEDEDFERSAGKSWWGKIKLFFLEMLRKAGLKVQGGLGDADLRHIIWQSYQHLKIRGKGYKTFAPGEREDKFNSWRFSYDENTEIKPSKAAEEERLYREGEEIADAFKDVDDPMAKKIAEGLIKVAQRNQESVEERIDAMHKIGGNMSKLRQAMSRQRAYDQKTAADASTFAKILLGSPLIGNLEPYNVARLLTAQKDAVGKENITPAVNRIVDVALDAMLNGQERMFDGLLNTRGKKVNQSGVEVMAGLDPHGQVMLETARELLDIRDDEKYSDRVAGIMGDLSTEDAYARMDGVAIADAYRNDIASVRDDIVEMEREIKLSKERVKQLREGVGMEDAIKAEREFQKSVEDRIRTARMELVDSYQNVIELASGKVGASAEKSKAFRYAQVKRAKEIQHFASSDMKGISKNPSTKVTKLDKAINKFAKTLGAPLSTFDSYLRHIGRLSPNGEGYLYNYFMRGDKTGWQSCRDEEVKNLESVRDKMDKKVADIFGKKMTWTDLYNINHSLGTEEVWWHSGDYNTDPEEGKIGEPIMVPHKLTQAQLLYISLVNKMPDGAMKLKRMGITDDVVRELEDKIDSHFVELGRWMQDELLPELRTRYNKVHEKLFGASMADIPNYFPLKINQRVVTRSEDVNVPQRVETAKIKTGSIIKRTINSNALDLENANAFDVLAEHIENMEHWAAFGQFSKDINTLLSYKNFRIQLENSGNLATGVNSEAWKRFRKVALMAAGNYEGAGVNTDPDNAMVAIARGVSGAKIAFRLFTAAKQLLSYPAYLSNASIRNLAIATAMPVTSWNWCMDNMPSFKNRWKSRIAGDYRLKGDDSSFFYNNDNIINTAKRWGIAPNAAVDALTVAMGAKAIFETKYHTYLKDGMSEEAARKQAIIDAEISFNETQQSAEAAYMAPIQADQTWESVALSIYRTAPFGYTRKMLEGFTTSLKMMSPEYRRQSYEYTKKQYERAGADEETADRNAKRKMNRTVFEGLLNIAIFGYVLPFFWNLGPYAPYLAAGDDDKKKKDMLKNAAIHAFAGPIEGLAMGNIISDGINMAMTDENLRNLNMGSTMPIVSDLNRLKNYFGTDNYRAAEGIVNLILQIGTGVNPQSFTDPALAIYDYFRGDINSMNEFYFFMLRMLNTPQSALNELYLDEVNMRADKFMKLDLTDMAKRYAEYNYWRSAPVARAIEKAFDNQQYDADMKRFENAFNTKVNERIKTITDGGADEVIENVKNETKVWKGSISDYNESIKAQMQEYADAVDRGEMTDEQMVEKMIETMSSDEYMSMMKARDYNALSTICNDAKMYPWFVSSVKRFAGKYFLGFEDYNKEFGQRNGKRISGFDYVEDGYRRLLKQMESDKNFEENSETYKKIAEKLEGCRNSSDVARVFEEAPTIQGIYEDVKNAKK